MSLEQRISVALLSIVVLAAPVAAQVTGPDFVVNVRGVRMSCRSSSGEVVAVYMDRQLQDVGIARRPTSGRPVIVINPRVTRQYSDLVTQWWFAHECAHHALPPARNSEPNADCYAIRELRRIGIVRNPDQLNAFADELGRLPGTSMGHLPGPLRAQAIERCALSG